MKLLIINVIQTPHLPEYKGLYRQLKNEDATKSAQSNYSTVGFLVIIQLC